MKKVVTLLLICLGLLALVVVWLPRLTTKETCTYEEAVERYARGQLVEVGDKKVHYIEKGEGAPVILIHGFMYHTVMWDRNIDALAEHFKVYAIDLFGWGFSERLEETEYSFARYAEQVTGFMDALGIETASLVGQSMGGGISVYTAARYPTRVDKLILAGPAVLPYPDTVTGKIFKLPLIGEFLNAIPGDALVKNTLKTLWFHDGGRVTDEYVRRVAQPLCIHGSYGGMMHILRNVLKEPLVEKEAHLLAGMRKPTLIIHGREDKAVPVEYSEALHDLWPGARLVLFERAGHNPQEEDPDRFNRLAIEFLSP
jgi:pimeloyl-ACP methyl ester carboxylesterase